MRPGCLSISLLLFFIEFHCAASIHKLGLFKRAPIVCLFKDIKVCDYRRLMFGVDGRWLISSDDDDIRRLSADREAHSCLASEPLLICASGGNRQEPPTGTGLQVTLSRWSQMSRMSTKGVVRCWPVNRNRTPDIETALATRLLSFVPVHKMGRDMTTAAAPVLPDIMNN